MPLAGAAATDLASAAVEHPHGVVARDAQIDPDQAPVVDHCVLSSQQTWTAVLRSAATGCAEQQVVTAPRAAGAGR
jgi:hypothetical protein